MKSLLILSFALLSYLLHDASCNTLTWEQRREKKVIEKVTDYMSDLYVLTDKNEVVRLPNSGEPSEMQNPRPIATNVRDFASYSNSSEQIHAFWIINNKGELLRLNSEGKHWIPVEVKLEDNTKAVGNSLAVGHDNVVMLTENGFVFVSDSIGKDEKEEIKWTQLKNIPQCIKIAAGKSEIFALAKEEETDATGYFYIHRIPFSHQTQTEIVQFERIRTPEKFHSIYASAIDDTLAGLNEKGMAFLLFKESSDLRDPTYAYLTKNDQNPFSYMKVVSAERLFGIEKHETEKETTIHYFSYKKTRLQRRHSIDIGSMIAMGGQQPSMAGRFGAEWPQMPNLAGRREWPQFKSPYDQPSKNEEPFQMKPSVMQSSKAQQSPLKRKLDESDEETPLQPTKKLDSEDEKEVKQQDQKQKPAQGQAKKSASEQEKKPLSKRAAKKAVRKAVRKAAKEAAKKAGTKPPPKKAAQKPPPKKATTKPPPKKAAQKTKPSGQGKKDATEMKEEPKIPPPPPACKPDGNLLPVPDCKRVLNPGFELPKPQRKAGGCPLRGK